MKKRIVEKKLSKFSFVYSEHWSTEKFELTDEPSCDIPSGYNNGLHLTKREARCLLEFLQECFRKPPHKVD